LSEVCEWNYSLMNLLKDVEFDRYFQVLEERQELLMDVQLLIWVILQY
jgi:hypothetical protein